MQIFKSICRLKKSYDILKTSLWKGAPSFENGAKHSPSELPLGGNIGKPGGPPLCMAWTPLDLFFSHDQNVLEAIRAWDPHDF